MRVLLTMHRIAQEKPAGSIQRRCTTWSSRKRLALSTADLLQHILMLEGYSMVQKQACKEDDQHA